MLNVEQTWRTGLAHLAANRLTDAESCFRLVVSSRPDFAAAHYHLGVVLRLRRQWREAGQAFRTAIKLAPDSARAYTGLGAVLDRLGQTAEAEARLRESVARDPDAKEAWLFLADLLRGKGELGESRVIYETLLTKYPGDADARFGRGFLNLLQGDLASGWQDYEFRQARRAIDPALSPQWRGEDPAGRTLLVYAEQGIGDTIQFLRYAPLLARKGARVLAAVPVPIMELASRVEGVAEVLQPSPLLPRFDYCAPLASLPLFFGTVLETIPWDGPYLAPPPGANPVALPANGTTKLTVALAWAGNPDHPNDHNRSMPVAAIRPLLEIPNISWLVLQKGAGANQLEAYADITRLGDALNNFSDIANVICSADLVITVDTSFCHLAGALGRPVWTLLSYAPDWRWLLDRTDSPWYPTMRLFRQPRPRDWPVVISEVAEALRQIVPPPREAWGRGTA